MNGSVISSFSKTSVKASCRLLHASMSAAQGWQRPGKQVLLDFGISQATYQTAYGSYQWNNVLHGMSYVNDDIHGKHDA